MRDMLWKLRWTEAALHDLVLLDDIVRRRIIAKVGWFGAQKDPLYFAKRLTNAKVGSYRFRIGDYRVLFDVEPSGAFSLLHILRVRHRREAYE